MPKVFVFGSGNDQQAWDVADKIKKDFPELKFIKTENIDDIFQVRGRLVIIDAVEGIKKPTLIGIEDLKKRKIFSLHDFDLGFFLPFLKKMGKTKNLKIIGIPKDIDKDVEGVKEILNAIQS